MNDPQTDPRKQPRDAHPAVVLEGRASPNGKVHWDGTREEGAVIQITGYGPSGNTFSKPDEPQFGKTN